MKRKMLVMLAVGFALTGYSQIGPVVTNLPTVSLGGEKIGLMESVATDGTDVRNALTIDYNINWFFLRGEMQLQDGEQFVHSVSAGLGFSRNWDTAKLYACIMGRRNYDVEQWQGVFGIGAAWTPFENGVLSRFSLFTEPRLITDFKIETPPGREILVGIRYSF